MAASRERNKSRTETRTLQSAAVTAEAAGFPPRRASRAGAARSRGPRPRDRGPAHQPAARAARRRRLAAPQPPRRRRGQAGAGNGRADAWGIENGLHARLDVSRRDDQCRLRSASAVWLHGIFARLANSLFMEWRGHQPAGRHKTTTDFMARMSEDHARRAVAAVTARNPNFKAS